MADNLEELAKALSGYGEVDGLVGVQGPDITWDGVVEPVREVWRDCARAVLRFLGFVNEKGEVRCPAEGAAGKAMRALEAVDRVWQCDSCSLVEDALRALKGEADG